MFHPGEECFSHNFTKATASTSLLNPNHYKYSVYIWAAVLDNRTRSKEWGEALSHYSPTSWVSTPSVPPNYFKDIVLHSVARVTHTHTCAHIRVRVRTHTHTHT